MISDFEMVYRDLGWKRDQWKWSEISDRRAVNWRYRGIGNLGETESRSPKRDKVKHAKG